jgi:aspartate kinase
MGPSFVLQGSSDGTRLVDLLDRANVVGKQLQWTAFGAAGDGVTIVISKENLHDEDRLRREIASAFGDRARLIDTLGAVSVVGAGINASYKNLRRGTACLTEGGINPQGVSTSSFRITWLVDRRRLDDAVRCLHGTLVTAESPPVP